MALKLTFPIRKKEKKSLHPAVYCIKHSYVLAAAAGRFVKPAGHMGKRGHTGYHHRCQINWGSQNMERLRHLCKSDAGKPVTQLKTESPSQESLLSSAPQQNSCCLLRCYPQTGTQAHFSPPCPELCGFHACPDPCRRAATC